MKKRCSRILSEDPVKFISNSLSPAVVDRVDIDKEEETALVIVPDNFL